ncbi:hypothetical protein AB0O34_07325 [Sphaerisporangium sp. NPDC088356]|uniref:hypothetical protein n=1 Tax=Sphaerisporangium sp. NPDC088356 TaxID=3154871 RepID=UPI0034416B55
MGLANGMEVNYLEALAMRLGREGWYARLRTPPDGRPSLHVINPEMPALEDQVNVQCHEEQAWFCFSWADRIAPVHDLDSVAARITGVLAVRHG